MKKRINIHTLKKTHVFKVPVAYFEALPLDIQHKIASLNELSIHNLPKELIFKVPQVYFEHLPAQIKERLGTWQTSQDIAQRQHTFEVPVGFFADLSDKIAAQTTENKASALAKIPNQVSVFQTPAGYFEWLPAKINAKINQKEQPRWRNATPQWSYAAAMALSVLLFGWGYFSFDTQESHLPKITKIKSEEKLHKPLIQENGIAENLAEIQDKDTQDQTLPTENTPNPQVKKETRQDKGKESSNKMQISQKINKIKPVDLIAYLSTVTLTESVLVEMMLDEELAETDEILLAVEIDTSGDPYEQFSEAELEELNKLLRKN